MYTHMWLLDLTILHDCFRRDIVLALQLLEIPQQTNIICVRFGSLLVLWVLFGLISKTLIIYSRLIDNSSWTNYSKSVFLACLKSVLCALSIILLLRIWLVSPVIQKICPQPTCLDLTVQHQKSYTTNLPWYDSTAQWLLYCSVKSAST